MLPDPAKLLEIAGIKIPLIGFYDVPDPKPFEPFVKPGRCYFSCYNNWLKGESVCISTTDSVCRGGSYWIGGKEFTTLENFAKELNEREGFKFSDELMYQWFENQAPYIIENGYVVIGPLKDDQYEYLKTVTFFVNPDQLSLLHLGAEYNNTSRKNHPLMAPFGSGCGQLAAVFNGFWDTPKAVIGTTDIAMREYLPHDIVAFTVNKQMYKQLCELDETSFLYKHFWKRLQKARKV